LREKENLAPRARFELATLRLTAESPIQSELAGVGANRGNSASCDETGRITFSFFIHLSFAFCRRSPLLVLRFYDGVVGTRYSLPHFATTIDIHNLQDRALAEARKAAGGELTPKTRSIGIPFIKIANRVEVTVGFIAKQISGPRVVYQQ
jgi:hypothetical protein